MKTFSSLILLTLVTALAGQSSAATYNFGFNSGFANGGVIPDGNATGWFDTRTISGISESLITDVNVSFTLSGGYNGDLYAFLSHSTGFSVLLNRVGRTSTDSFGYGDAGFNVTFDDSAANGDIHNYQTVSGYLPLIGNGDSWSPDGRNVNPALALDTNSRTHLLNQFNGTNPNGDWTLFVADLSSGEQSMVVGWGLNVTAVPEPSSLCLGVIGLLALVRRRANLFA